jgi:hypothetical protein
MPRKRTDFFRGRTKTELVAEIREELEKHGFDTAFEYPLLSDLIAERHYYCSEHHLRPTRFRKLGRPGWAYDFQGWFDGHGWHRVSWTQCTLPRRDEDWIARAIRDAIQPVKTRHRREHPICERCRNAPSTEVHHVRPTMDQIVAAATRAVTEEQWRSEARRWDWWSPDAYSLDPQSPVVVEALRMHDEADLQALCHECHMAVENEQHI